jgi:hypothetical protein
MKKVISTLVALIMMFVAVAPAFANSEQYSVYIRFADGTARQYNKVPAETTIEVLAARIQRDFPDKSLTTIVEATAVNTTPQAQPVYANYAPQQAATPAPQQEGFCSSSGCKVLVGVASIALLAYGVKHFGGSTKAFPCVLPTDRARDGSMCGGRASSVRPGGR